MQPGKHANANCAAHSFGTRHPPRGLITRGRTRTNADTPAALFALAFLIAWQITFYTLPSSGQRTLVTLFPRIPQRTPDFLLSLVAIRSRGADSLTTEGMVGRRNLPSHSRPTTGLVLQRTPKPRPSLPAERPNYQTEHAATSRSTAPPNVCQAARRHGIEMAHR